MKTSETITKISVALLKAQKKIGGAKKGAANPFFHSKYADLPTVMETCKDSLNENGISVLQPVMGDYVETVLLHTSGEFISSETRIVIKEEKKDDPQAYGSAVTYARRYGLQSMVFIPSEDDDAEGAMNRPFQKPSYPPKNYGTQSNDQSSNSQPSISSSPSQANLGASPAQMKVLVGLSKQHGFELKESYTKKEASELMGKYFKAK